MGCFELRDGGGGGRVIFVVNLDDDEGGVGGFWDGFEMFTGGGIADASYDGMVRPGEVGC